MNKILKAYKEFPVLAKSVNLKPLDMNIDIINMEEDEIIGLANPKTGRVDLYPKMIPVKIKMDKELRKFVIQTGVQYLVCGFEAKETKEQK